MSAPTLQVVRDAAQRHVDAVQVVDELLYSGPGPKGTANLHLVRVLVDVGSLDFFLLLGRQCPFFSLLAALGLFFGKPAVSFESSDYAAHRIIRDSHCLDNFIMLFPAR